MKIEVRFGKTGREKNPYYVKSYLPVVGSNPAYLKIFNLTIV